jgi:hypothetical protein
VDYSWIVGLIVSAAVYLLLSRSLDLGAEKVAIESSERQLAALDAEIVAPRPRPQGV